MTFSSVSRFNMSVTVQALLSYNRWNKEDGLEPVRSFGIDVYTDNIYRGRGKAWETDAGSICCAMCRHVASLLAKNLGRKGASRAITEMGLALWEAVFVFYCCVTKHQKLSGLKQHKCIISQFL